MKRIGIIAPSSVVPLIELELGVSILKDCGFEVTIHPNCKKKYLFWAGIDHERSQAILDFVFDPKIDVIWCARGGYGSSRCLPFLDQSPIPPKKLMIGYSDATALLHYAYTRWNYPIVHGPMIAGNSWHHLIKKYQLQLTQFCETLDYSHFLPYTKPLRFLTQPKAFEGLLIGGNLTVLASLLGTPYEVSTKNRILFLEDIDENLYRIDRLINQLYQAGWFLGIQGILLGSFYQCLDKVPLKLNQPHLTPPRISLRKTYSQQTLLKHIFSICHCPVVSGIPAGHSPTDRALPLGIHVSINRSGLLKFYP